MICRNCGNSLPDDSQFCNKCGCQIETDNEVNESQNKFLNDMSISNQKILSDAETEKPKRNMKKLIVMCSILIVILICSGGVWYYQYTQTQETLKLEEAKQKYASDLKAVVSRIMDISARAEDVNNKYSDVWSEVIDRGVITIGGNLAFDFNKAIQLQQEEFSNKIKYITSNKELIAKELNKLNHPPNEYKIAYDITVELFGVFTEFTSLAESPKGSLTSFNQTTDKLSSEISKKYQEFKVRIP
ncbi:zinc-ribbon domain-containing protein [Brevibacillus ginsengisoli]|uniref:zinc-ribbon domain-containing protein n=1 Tax=Brevibacillus ginsengisoli TaxID=363854 RepID=UPI003CFB2BCF